MSGAPPSRTILPYPLGPMMACDVPHLTVKVRCFRTRLAPQEHAAERLRPVRRVHDLLRHTQAQPIKLTTRRSDTRLSFGAAVLLPAQRRRLTRQAHVSLDDDVDGCTFDQSYR